MADASQTLTGKWDLKLKHNYDVTIPVTLKYNNANPVTVNVKNTYVTASTQWQTDVGTAIDTSKITYQSEDVMVGNKLYTVTALTWSSVTPAQRTLTATLTPDTYDSGGGNGTLAITSNSNWTITTNANWVSVPTTAGTGDLSQTITISNFTGTTSRTATITVTCGSIVKTFTITQSAVAPTISITAPTPVASTATSMSYTVTSNVDAVTVKYGNQTKTTKTGTFTIPANTGINPVTHVITASCTNYPTVTATTSVVQNAASYGFSVNPTSFSFSNTGGSKTMTITNPNGFSWQIQNLPSWISASVTAGTGNATVTLTATQTTDARSGNFVVKDVTNNRTTTITCSQEAGVFSVGELRTFEYTGGTLSFQITDTIGHNWQITSSPSWATVSPTTGSTSQAVNVTVGVFSGETALMGRDGNIVVKDLNNNVTYNVYAAQKGLNAFAINIYKDDVKQQMPDGDYFTISGITQNSTTYEVNIFNPQYIYKTQNDPFAIKLKQDTYNSLPSYLTTLNIRSFTKNRLSNSDFKCFEFHSNPDYAGDEALNWTGTTTGTFDEKYAELREYLKTRRKLSQYYDGSIVLRSTAAPQPQPYDICNFEINFGGFVDCTVGEGCKGTLIDTTSSNDLIFRPSDDSSIYAACGFEGDIKDSVGTKGEGIFNFRVYNKDASTVTIDFGVNFEGTYETDWMCSSVILQMTLFKANTSESKLVELRYNIGSQTKVSKEIDLSDWWELNGNVNITAELGMTFVN